MNLPNRRLYIFWLLPLGKLSVSKTNSAYPISAVVISQPLSHSEKEKNFPA
jgi:hypothetical protein